MILPTTNSLNGKLLYLLMTRKKIDHLEFQRLTNSYRMAASVHNLEKRYRWKIGRAYEGVYCHYWLTDEDKKLARSVQGKFLSQFMIAVKSLM